MENQQTKGQTRKVITGIQCVEWRVDAPVSVEIRKGSIRPRLQANSIGDRKIRGAGLHFRKGSLAGINQTDLRKELLC
jgi:hypothetical protein